MKYAIITLIGIKIGVLIWNNYFIKNQTPTYQITLEQFKELNDIADKKFYKDIKQITNEFIEEYPDIFENISNSGMDYTTILEIINIIINLF